MENIQHEIAMCFIIWTLLDYNMTEPVSESLKKPNTPSTISLHKL